MKEASRLSLELDRYLEDDTYSYAIMIDGVWGCGKTFFIKKYINGSLVAKNRKCIYISLYGLNDINDLKNQIKLQYIFGKKYEKKYEITKIGTSIALDFLEAKGVDRKYVNQALNLIKKDSVESNNIVLVLDDLERSTVPVVDVLGYVNGLVEHQKYKVIILANEKEIDYETSNLELKYLVAKDPNLMIIEETHQNNEDINSILFEKNEATSDQGKEIDSETLKKRTQWLFSEKSRYFLIKEKVIGETYLFDIDIKTSMTEILDTYLLTNKNFHTVAVKNIILEKINDIAEKMEERGHKNLRTFQFFLSKMLRMAECLNSQCEKHEDFIDLILRNNCLFIFSECIRFKQDEYWEDNKNLIESFLSGYITGIETIDDSDFAKRLLLYYEASNNENEVNQALNNLENWMNLNSEIVKGSLDILKSSIDKISLEFYRNILTKFVSLEKYNIIDTGYIIEFINAMKKSIDRTDRMNEFIENMQKNLFESDLDQEKYELLVKKLVSEVDTPVFDVYDYVINSIDNIDRFKKANGSLILFKEGNVKKLFDEMINSDDSRKLRKYREAIHSIFLSKSSDSDKIIKLFKDNRIMLDEMYDLCSKKLNENNLDSIKKMWLSMILLDMKNIKNKYNDLIST